ncbi:MAG: hypothetical protein GY934_15495, partial [Gammaproteobacteria bacterium]|nr:hypothetical protein [Gammaproteobacteria bacterium]
GKGTGRGMDFFSQSSLAILLLLALRMPKLATTGTWSNPLESRLSQRPLTDPEFDEACLKTMSTNPLNLSPTMPGLFTEHPDPKGVVGELKHPVAHEDHPQVILVMVCLLLVLGQGLTHTQATFACLLSFSQPVLAALEDGNTGPGFVGLLSLLASLLLLYWGGFKLLHLMDDLTTAVMATADEETESEVSTEDDIEDGAHGDDEEQVEVEEDTELTSQLPECLCFFPDPQIPCVLFKGEHYGEEDDIDENLGVPIFKVKLIKEYLLDPARELTGPLGINLLPHIPLISIDKTNALLRSYCLDQVVRHIAKAYPASLPRHVREALGWSKEILKSNERVKLQCELLWCGFLTIVKSSQSAYPLMVGQQGILAVKGISLTLIRGVYNTIRLAYGISGLPHISTAHSLF